MESCRTRRATGSFAVGAGLPLFGADGGFAAARLPEDLPLLARARAVARRLVERDLGLSDPAWGGVAALVRAREAAAGDPSAGG